MTQFEYTPRMRSSPATVLRSIKSFVKREGRMTHCQKRALASLWPRYGIDLNSGTLDNERIFVNPGPVTLEIGFGMGESLVEMAKQNPDKNFLGIEVHRPGVGRLLSCADKLDLNNLAVICADAVDVVSNHLADNSLQCVQIFFPDPWHKKKHHKRRLIQTAFISTLAAKITPGGLLHIATDWQHYADHIVKVLQNYEGLINTAGSDIFVERPQNRPLTRFEQRGCKLGHQIWDIVYRKQAQTECSESNCSLK